MGSPVTVSWGRARRCRGGPIAGHQRGLRAPRAEPAARPPRRRAARPGSSHPPVTSADPGPAPPASRRSQRRDALGRDAAADARHGTPAAAALRATPRAVLPNAVCSSIRPSPVITRSAPASRSSKPVSCITTSMPGTSSKRPHPRREAEQAEARPAGRSGAGDVAGPRSGRRLEQIGVVGEPGLERRPRPPARRPSAGRRPRRLRARRGAGWSRRRRCAAPARRDAGPAPPGLPPPGPGSGPAAGRPSCRDTRRPGHGAGRSRRRWWRCRPRPSGCGERPHPGRPTRTSPVPSVVAASGLRGSPSGRRDRPDASASSTAARVPSAERSQRAVRGRPSGSWAGHSCHSQPPVSAMAASVPSPPSASGARISSSVGAGARPALRQRPGHLHRRERTLERIRGQQNPQPVVAPGAHGSPPGPPGEAGPRPVRRAFRRSGIRAAVCSAIRPRRPRAASPGTRECESSAAARDRPAR